MCTGGSTRKHTPITTRKQQRLFGYWHSHPGERPKSITSAEVEAHLSESKGKDLPERAKKSHTVLGGRRSK
jgi:hypothetical protein